MKAVKKQRAILSSLKIPFLVFCLFLLPLAGFSQCVVKKPTLVYTGTLPDTICINSPVNYLITNVKPDNSSYSLSYSFDGITYSANPVKIDTLTAGNYNIYIRQSLISSPSTCSAFSNFSIVILPAPPAIKGVKPRPNFPADPLNRTLFVCEGYSYNLNDSINGPDPGYSLKWTATNASGNTVPFTGILSKVKYTGRDTSFFVRNYAPGSCAGKNDTIIVSVLPMPHMRNSPSQYQVCETKPVTFTALDVHTGNDPKYDWYINDTLKIAKSGPVYLLSPNPYKSGQKVKVYYIVHISKDAPYYHCDSVGPPTGGKFVSDTISIKILPLSKQPFPYGPVIVYQGQKNAFYQVPLDTTLTYSWRVSNPKNETISFANNTARVNYSDSLDFSSNHEIIDTIVLTVRNTCDSIQGRLVVHIRPYLKPINILTPNGDGINDKWVIYNIDNDAYKSNQIMIYDRYGSMVFKASNYTNYTGWDGTFNGRPLSEGTYYYIILFKEDTFTKTLKGYINILRK